MAGRATDPNESDSDREFAKNIGIKFHTVEDFFGVSKLKMEGPNGAVITVLLEMSELLKRKKDFTKGNALARAARAIQEHGVELESGKEAQKIKHVGPSTAVILEEVRDTSKCKALEELREEMSA